MMVAGAVGSEVAEKKGPVHADGEAKEQNVADGEDEDDNEDTSDPVVDTQVVATLLLDALDLLGLADTETAAPGSPAAWVREQERRVVVLQGEIPSDQVVCEIPLPAFLRDAVEEIVSLRTGERGIGVADGLAGPGDVIPSTWDELVGCSWPAYRRLGEGEPDDDAQASPHRILDGTPMVPPWLVGSDDLDDSDGDSAAANEPAVAALELGLGSTETSKSRSSTRTRTICAGAKLEVALHLLATLRLHRGHRYVALLGEPKGTKKLSDEKASNLSLEEAAAAAKKNHRVRAGMIAGCHSQQDPAETARPTRKGPITVGDLVEALSPDQRETFGRCARMLREDYENRGESFRLRRELARQDDGGCDTSRGHGSAAALGGGNDCDYNDEWMTWRLSDLIQHFTAPHSPEAALGYGCPLPHPTSTPPQVPRDPTTRFGLGGGRPDAQEHRKPSAEWVQDDSAPAPSGSVGGDTARPAFRATPGSVPRPRQGHPNRRHRGRDGGRGGRCIGSDDGGAASQSNDTKNQERQPMSGKSRGGRRADRGRGKGGSGEDSGSTG